MVIRREHFRRKVGGATGFGIVAAGACAAIYAATSALAAAGSTYPYIVTPLEHLGTNSNAGTDVSAWAVNDSGTAVGHAVQFNSTGAEWLGWRALRWDAGSSQPIRLGHLGTSSTGFTYAAAASVNGPGTAVGAVRKYDAGGEYSGWRAVRWSAGSTAPVELTHIGASSFATGINDSDTVVGYAENSDLSTGVTWLGVRALRWTPGAQAPVLLDHLGTDTEGETESKALDVNNEGITVGDARKHAADGRRLGLRALRWESGGAAAELGHLGTRHDGFTNSIAVAVNESGTAVGSASAFSSDGWQHYGERAVRWEAGSTAAVELGHLGTISPGGHTLCFARGINDAGVAVGWAATYDGNIFASRAVLWDAGSTFAVNLNDWIDPASGWTLLEALDINNNGVIVGSGLYDPDGPGGVAAEAHGFRMLPIPEPSASITIMIVAALASARSRTYPRP